MKTALKTPVINSPISKGFSCCTCRQKAGFAHYLYRHLPGFASPSQLPAQRFDCRQWLQSYNPTSSPSPQLSQRCSLCWVLPAAQHSPSLTFSTGRTFLFAHFHSSPHGTEELPQLISTQHRLLCFSQTRGEFTSPSVGRGSPSTADINLVFRESLWNSKH